MNKGMNSVIMTDYTVYFFRMKMYKYFSFLFLMMIFTFGMYLGFNKPLRHLELCMADEYTSFRVNLVIEDF